MGTGLAGLSALLALTVVLVAGSASAKGPQKLVEGTVYDTTCATACMPECPPPPCGPVTARSRTGSDIVCAQKQQRTIVCPLETTSPRIVCVRAPCHPVYSGEGAIVKVRRRGSSTVLAELPVVEGHFEVRLGRGEYVLHPYLPEEPCWSGEPVMLKVTPRPRGPVSATIDVHDGCVAHPD
jgi:hypothetical protein